MAPSTEEPKSALKTNAPVELKMEKLTPSNYTSWKTCLKNFLISRDLWDIAMKKTEGAKVNAEVKAIIYSTMTSAQITDAGTCNTANELWLKIRENYEGAEQDLKNTALSEFLGIRYKKGENIINFCGRYENLLGRLLSTGFIVEESTKIWAFKNSLPKDMKETVSNWELARPSNKVTDLMSIMKARYKNQGESDETIALFSGMKIQKKTNEKFNKHPESNKVECTYCKKTGHIWKNCYKLKEDNKRKKKFANNKKRPSEESYIAHF